METKITVVFHHMADIDRHGYNRIEGVCLTMAEVEGAEWTVVTEPGTPSRVCLTYRTDRNASDVVASWEDEGFDFANFHSFSFSR